MLDNAHHNIIMLEKPVTSTLIETVLSIRTSYNALMFYTSTQAVVKPIQWRCIPNKQCKPFLHNYVPEVANQINYGILKPKPKAVVGVAYYAMGHKKT